MSMSASAFVKEKRGYFPVTIIDFEKGRAVIHSERGREEIMISDIYNLRIYTSIPLVINPK